MMTIHKKLIVDEKSTPTDVIIPWADFLEISEILGFDLEEVSHGDLEQARVDRKAGNKEAYLSLDDI